MNRRDMMLLTGIGALTAAMPTPVARAAPVAPPPAAPPTGGHLFADQFAGPARPAPHASQWAGALGRRAAGEPTVSGPPGPVRHDHRHPRRGFVDGKSNLVFRAAKDGNTFYSGKLFGKWRGGIGHNWEARIKLNCLTPGSWPAWYLANNDPTIGGEVDIMEWYGNGHWAAGTAVHAKLNGGEHVSQTISVDSAWHTWRGQGGDAGMRVWRGHTRRAPPEFHRARPGPPGRPLQ